MSLDFSGLPWNAGGNLFCWRLLSLPYKSPNRSSNDNRIDKFLKYLATSWHSAFSKPHFFALNVSRTVFMAFAGRARGTAPVVLPPWSLLAGHPFGDRHRVVHPVRIPLQGLGIVRCGLPGQFFIIPRSETVEAEHIHFTGHLTLCSTINWYRNPNAAQKRPPLFLKSLALPATFDSPTSVWLSRYPSRSFDPYPWIILALLR